MAHMGRIPNSEFFSMRYALCSMPFLPATWNVEPLNLVSERRIYEYYDTENLMSH